MSDDPFFDWWTWATIAFIPVAVWLFILDRRRQRAVVQEWAWENRVTLVHRLPTWYRLSPFVFTELLGGNQRIEYWIVKDSVGLEYRVWLKIGSYLRGATRETEAEWDG